MLVGLLYRDKDWNQQSKQYFDWETIREDLGLKTLFDMASKEIQWSGKTVKRIEEADTTIMKNMEKVMMVPLKDAEEILYRQEVIRDFEKNEELIFDLYRFAKQVLSEWQGLGRGIVVKTSGFNSSGDLVNQIHVIQLFLDSLGILKRKLSKYKGKLSSGALCSFIERLEEEFSDEYEAGLREIMKDVDFYIKDAGDDGKRKNSAKTRMKLVLSYDEGMKFTGWKLADLGTDKVRSFGSANPIGMVQSFVNSKIPYSVCVEPDSALHEDAMQLEYQVVKYVLTAMNPFLLNFRYFFDQLLLQTSFYKGAILLNKHMERLGISGCFPTPGERFDFTFSQLKEYVMALEQLVNPVGNDCHIRDKNMLIVTGANQGGKSTFLRSVGIAQVMMQCGLKVAATQYSSGVYPTLFTHFTRREDSEMNSGRLDEELDRMSQIIDQLSEGSMVLLNESFATTTEKDGSKIAYDILTAFQDKKIMVLTVTHLLGFARKMYENDERREQTEFLSAERMEDGSRTFRMVQGEPSLQSFGLDLYEKYIKIE